MKSLRTTYRMLILASRRNLSYRVEWIAGAFQLVLLVWIKVAVWRAIITHSPEPAANAGVTLPQMVTYMILAALLGAFTTERVSRDLEARLKTGDIAHDLLKPVGLLQLLIGRSLGSMLADLVVRLVPVAILAIPLWGLGPPPNATAAVQFAFGVILAIVFTQVLGLLLGTIGFWVLRTRDISWFLFSFVRLISGQFVPYWFLPPWVQRVGEALPFHILAHTPVGIYVGRITGPEAYRLLALGFIWTVALSVLLAALWARTVRRLVVQGG